MSVNYTRVLLFKRKALHIDFQVIQVQFTALNTSIFYPIKISYYSLSTALLLAWIARF